MRSSTTTRLAVTCTRQLFGRRDIGKYKVQCLARAIANDGLFPTTITAQPFRFQELCEVGEPFDHATVLCCGVDNNGTRRAVCEYAHARGLPVIYAAVSRTGNEAYTMVQHPTGACWACAFPHYVNDQTYPCNLPASLMS